MSEEDFYEMSTDITHSEIDEAITYATTYDVKTMVEQYGWVQALQLYESELGGVANLIKSADSGKDYIVYTALLYWIIHTNIEITWDSYKEYCAEHPIC